MKPRLRPVLSASSPGASVATRSTTAYLQSEPLAIAEQPIMGEVGGFAVGPGMLKSVADSGDTVTDCTDVPVGFSSFVT